MKASSLEPRGPSLDAQFSSYIVWIQERDRLRTETEALPWVSWLCLGVHVGTMLAQASSDGKMLKYWKRPAVFTYFVIRAFATANFILAVLWCSVGGQSDMIANILTIMYFVCETVTQGAILVAFLLRTLILWHSHLVLLDAGFFLWIAVSAFHLVNCFTYHFAGSPYDLRIVYALPPRFGFLRFGPYFADFGFTCLVTALTIVGSGRYAKRHLVGSFHSMTERTAQEKATQVANSILSHQLIFFAISALATALIGSLGLAEAFNGYSALIRLPIGLLMQSTMACALIQNLRRLQQDAAQLAAVRRHHEVVEDYEREWARVEKRRDRRDVLEGVRGDISAYKSRQATAEASLLNERDRISNSHSMIDSSLEQAYATRANLAQQRSVIQNATSRLQSTAAQIPGLNTIITRINRRRKRDSIIMGCVLGACALLLLWRWFG
ncbi:v-snare protein [Ceraceosorus bombacis]|uniref:V-snare protein n=1 Tax=Ceraceosorus bombacis TaxID=401625 RepID=A0A0P1BJW8_9BASI|nr:v-snare protein [Ceraceosorus bombacis]